MNRKCKKCNTLLVKIRDFIKQSGYSYYLECPKCTKDEISNYHNKESKESNE